MITIISVAIVTVIYGQVMLLALLLLIFWLSNVVVNIGLLFCSGICNISFPLIFIHALSHVSIPVSLYPYPISLLLISINPLPINLLDS